MKSIQTKLTVIILIILFIALSTMGGLNFFKAREIVTDNLAREMGNEASNAADDVGVWLEGRIAQLTMLAATPTMARGTLAEIVPLMEAARQSDKAYESMVFVEASGVSHDSQGPVANVAAR